MIMLPQNIKVHSKKRNGKTVSLGTWAKEKFYEILKREDFNYSTHPYRKTNDFKKVNDDGRSLSQYMLKYIQKTISMAKSDEYGNNSTIYFLYGWKTTNRIRHYSTSQVPFNTIEYKKLYHILNNKEKKSLITQANASKTNLMTELSKVVSIQRETYEQNISLTRTTNYEGRISDMPIIQGDEFIVKTKQPLQCEFPTFIIQSKTLKTKNSITHFQNYSNDKEHTPIFLKDKRVLVELEIIKNGESRYKKSDFSS